MRRQRPKSADTLRQKLLRQLTIWIGLSCALTQLSATAHDLLVDHVRCAEHGEWVHAAHEHATSFIGSETPDAADGVKTVAPERGGESREAHEHCLVWSDRHNPALAPPSALELTVLDNSQATALAAPSSLAFASEVYSFAPKTSPPDSNRSS